MASFKLNVGFCWEGTNYKAGDVIDLTEHEAKVYSYAGKLVTDEVREDGKKAKRTPNKRRIKQVPLDSGQSE